MKSCLFDMLPSWPETIPEVLTALNFGWSYLEKLYKRRLGLDQTDLAKRSQYDDGRIGWRSFEIRGQESLLNWQFSEDGELEGLWQTPAPDYTPRFVPIEKALHFVFRSNKRNPEGYSFLRGCYWPWYMVTNFSEVEAIGYERDHAGLAVLYLPREVLSPKPGDAAATAALSEYESLITNLKRDEEVGVLLPSERDAHGNLKYELKLLSTGGSRQFNTSQIIDRYDSRILMTLLADFLMLGMRATGSYSLGVTKAQLFESSLKTILDRICSVVNSQAIPELIGLNDFDGLKGLPQLTYESLSVPSLSELGAFIAQVAGAQDYLIDDLVLENHLRRKAGLPSRDRPREKALAPPRKVAPGLGLETDEEKGEEAGKVRPGISQSQSPLRRGAIGRRFLEAAI